MRSTNDIGDELKNASKEGMDSLEKPRLSLINVVAAIKQLRESTPEQQSGDTTLKSALKSDMIWMSFEFLSPRYSAANFVMKLKTAVLRASAVIRSHKRNRLSILKECRSKRVSIKELLKVVDLARSP